MYRSIARERADLSLSLSLSLYVYIYIYIYIYTCIYTCIYIMYTFIKHTTDNQRVRCLWSVGRTPPPFPVPPLGDGSVYSSPLSNTDPLCFMLLSWFSRSLRIKLIMCRQPNICVNARGGGVVKNRITEVDMFIYRWRCMFRMGDVYLLIYNDAV